jgi:hypothetical protein
VQLKPSKPQKVKGKKNPKAHHRHLAQTEWYGSSVVFPQMTLVTGRDAQSNEDIVKYLARDIFPCAYIGSPAGHKNRRKRGA